MWIRYSVCEVMKMNDDEIDEIMTFTYNAIEIYGASRMEVGEDEAGDWTDKSYLEPVIGYLNS